MKWLFLSTAVAAITISTSAVAQTTVALNTGYNNAAFNVYTTPAPSPDNFWIKVAASNPPVPAPSFMINPHQAWAPALPNSRWIGATPTGMGAPFYAIYRKCFCLMPGYRNPQLSFQIRGDDSIQVWLNGVAGTILPAQGGSFGGPPLSGTAQVSQFRAGVNCLYVLVEDTGGVISGFNLSGTVSAFGLMPVPAAGTATSFAPCNCGPTGRGASFNDRAVVQSLVRVAQARQRGQTAQ